MTERQYWEEMRMQLMTLTMRRLKAIARDEDICLGYAASNKAACVGEIVSQRRHRAANG